MGREKPRSGTGSLDRAAHQRHAYARSDLWLFPGTYRIRARIQFTTSFASGAVVFGNVRRDRNLRFGFSAGDFLYAIGESDAEPTFESVRWSLRGLRERDGALGGSNRGGNFQFDAPTPVFELELLVDGPTVRAFLDGTRVATYHTVDGAPVQGYLGFATSMGAIRVQRPVIERLDRSRLAGRFEKLGGPPPGLDLAGTTARPFDQLLNQPLYGLPPATEGTLVMWVPAEEEESGGEPFDPDWVYARARRGAEQAARQLEREGFPQALALVVPEALGEERTRALAEDLEWKLATPPRLVAHRFAGPEGSAADGGMRWVLFVDSAGAIRFAEPYFGQVSVFRGALGHWLAAFRDHGRPPRELPSYGRETESESPDGPSGE